jgi:hypothetical protein
MASRPQRLRVPAVGRETCAMLAFTIHVFNPYKKITVVCSLSGGF